MRKTITAGLIAGAALAVGFAVPAQAISATNADLYVLHAIPDTPVDVYVNGERTLDDFQPGDLAGPLDLPAGDYEVALTATDAADASDPILGPTTVTLAANTSYTATANLDASGAPALNAFANDIATTAAGEGRLTVRHVAAAPAVDVLAGGAPVVEDLTNPNEATLALPASTVSASVALAGTTDPVIGPADVAIQDGSLTIVYAWGSAEDANLALAVQTITVGHTSPGGVPSGTAGYAAAQDAATSTLWMLGSALGVAMLVAFAAITVRRARAQRASR